MDFMCKIAHRHLEYKHKTINILVPYLSETPVFQMNTMISSDINIVLLMTIAHNKLLKSQSNNKNDVRSRTNMTLRLSANVVLLAFDN